MYNLPTAGDPECNGSDAGVPVECARELLGLTFTEVPSKQFFVLRAEHMVVEAAASMHQIMEKLQLYRNRLTIFFEVGSTQC